MTAERIDWSQLWYPGPRREFSAEELARGGSDRPSRTFVVVLCINLAILAEIVLQRAPDGELARLTALLAAFGLLAYRGSLWLWRSPSRRRLAIATTMVTLVYVAFGLGIHWRVANAAAAAWLLYACAFGFSACVVAFWFITVFRAHQIAARLRELDERERAVELARQLASAQIQPHFLFNSLASLQHWVDTRDDRAGPMLASLTAYLRATLPLFERRALTVGEELEAAQRYLEVMQARLGARLRFSIELDPAAAATAVPPGVLLTLVENAVEHGVQPQLAGGRVRLSARRADDGAVLVEIADDGPGLPPRGDAAPLGHVGLANTRARLAQAFGERATLVLSNLPEGGCLARLTLPPLHSRSP